MPKDHEQLADHYGPRTLDGRPGLHHLREESEYVNLTGRWGARR
ncbi:hypothetical protein [Streptomyces sp. NPDC014623]